MKLSQFWSLCTLVSSLWLTCGCKQGSSLNTLLLVGGNQLGNVAKGSQLKFSIDLTNESGSSLTVETIQTSCGCVTMNPGAVPIEMGAKQTVQVPFVLSVAEKEDGEYETDIVLKLKNDHASSIEQFTVTYGIQSFVHIKPNRVYYLPGLDDNNVQPQAVQILPARKGQKVLNVVASPKFLDMLCDQRELTNGGRELTIHGDRLQQVSGEIYYQLPVDIQASDGNMSDKIVIGGRFRLSDELEAVPSFVALGASSAKSRVVLKGKTGDKPVVADLSHNDEVFRSYVTVEAASNTELVISVSPDAKLAMKGSVLVSVPDSKTILSIPIYYSRDYQGGS
jgi:hypothetical protein